MCIVVVGKVLFFGWKRRFLFVDLKIQLKSQKLYFKRIAKNVRVVKIIYYKQQVLTWIIKNKFLDYQEKLLFLWLYKINTVVKARE